MTPTSGLALTGLLASFIACSGGGDHPPPIGEAGTTFNPPVIIETGGRGNGGGEAGTGSPGSSGSSSRAGDTSVEGIAGDTSLGGSSTAGDTSLGGSSTAGDTSLGGRGSLGGASASGGSLDVGTGGTFSNGDN